ncbi:MAG TPA: flavodoxin domain-containing protein [Chitinophagaceae bacterium]|nr:flavodoxin domain-containing protein [Chitinophagaceae bacterium]
MKILIVYGTTEGQTRKIARYMQNALQESGHQVTISDAADEPPGVVGFDAVLIGGSLHMHKYQSALQHYIKDQVVRLNQLPGAFFSVCLAVASGLPREQREAEKIMEDFLQDTGWRPLMTTQVAGALRYTEYDFFKRLLMKLIARREGHPTETSQDYEYTDWEAVRKFATEFARKAAVK